MNNTIKCSRCGKTFKSSGIEVHITRAHGYEIWKEQQERKAK